MHYDEAGTGPPLVMIAGLGSVRGSWADAMEDLSRDFRCLSIDNRDAGENDPETRDYSIADMAADTADFLRAMHIVRAHVMGSSMGGFIALHLALNDAALVDSLILVGTSAVTGLVPMPAPNPNEWIADPVERAWGRLPETTAPGYFAAHPERLAVLADQTRLNRMTAAGYARQVKAINETHDVRDRLGEITAPTLVIHGDQDGMVPLTRGKQLAVGIPNARLVTLEGVGHVPHREVPDEFCQLVRGFVTA
jgi:pimeloyl-ACP methyl ester carboxylesterase